MAEMDTVEAPPAPTETEASADLEAGFTDAPVDVQAEASADEGKPAPVETPPAPVYVQITEDEHRRFLSNVETVEKIASSLEQRFGTAFGKIGGLEQKLKEVMTATPRGAAVEVSDDDLAEIKEEFPWLADMTKKALNRVLGRLTGTGPSFDADKVKEVLKGELASSQETFKKNWAVETLDGLEDEWRTVVGLKQPDGSYPDTAYRRWLATQPQAYQTALLDAWNPYTIAKSIAKFRTETTPKPKQTPPAPPARFAAAVTPKGDGGKPTGPTPEDDFEAGFRS